jgi:c-di-GMP-binding flagellar brake protein YcgR
MAQPQASEKFFPPANADRITTPQIIFNLLKRLHDRRAMVNISVPGYREQYLSTLLDVNPEQDYLILDELKIGEGNQRLLKRGQYHFHAVLKGIEISFSNTLEEVGRSGGFNFYRSRLPRAIYYYQRRAHYRAHISLAQSIPVSLSEQTMDHLSGLLMDISVGGIGAQLKTVPKLSLDRGDRFSRCLIELPSGIQLATELEIRFIEQKSTHRAQQRVRLGGRFLNMDPQQEKTVERFVLKMERELIKKMPRED